MLKIKFSQTGKKGARKYRIIVNEARSKRNGNYKDIIGWYDKSVSPPLFKLDKEKLDYWLKQGAQLTPAVKKIIDERYS
ncbi:MAG: 30S ribosomal protein S16 [Microgenomates group bacterium]